MSILVKAIIGGLMTALIAWLSTRGNVLPGIAPLFPTLTLIALYIVGAKGDPNSRPYAGEQVGNSAEVMMR